MLLNVEDTASKMSLPVGQYKTMAPRKNCSAKAEITVRLLICLRLEESNTASPNNTIMPIRLRSHENSTNFTPKPY